MTVTDVKVLKIMEVKLSHDDRLAIIAALRFSKGASATYGKQQTRLLEQFMAV